MSILHPWRGIRPWKRHSLVLFIAGLVYIMIGISFITTKPTPAKLHALHFAIEWWSLPTWGIVFITAGALSIISSRWPPISETWGYTVLTGLSAAWSAFYLVAIWFDSAPPSNISQVLTWGIIAFMWWAISGLTNPGPPTLVGK